MSELTQNELTKVMNYDPETGVFTWLKNMSSRARVGYVAGSMLDNGYIQIRISYRYYLAHRLAWMITHNKWPDNYIDHINGIKTDNRICNLRDVTHQENGRNRKISSNNTSGITGVSWINKNKSWQAGIKIDRKVKYLYSGKDFFQACCARKSAEAKYGFHENNGRNINLNK